MKLNRILKLPRNYSLFLFGARNTGKSTLIKEQFMDALYIDLLDPETEDRFSRSPKELKYIVDALPDSVSHLIIDEIQKIPKLLDIVHSLIESSKVRFILTGSSARKIKRGSANFLAGRAFVYNLYPLSHIELGDLFNLKEALQYGTLPKIFHFKNEVEKKDFLNAYAYTYLKEEVWAEQLIRKLDPFRKFLEVASQMNGKIINYSKISRDVGVDDKTVQQYFQILEDTLIGFSLEGFQHSIRKRLISKPKFYFFDTGVKRALAKELSIPVNESTYQYGELFEQYIILECIKLSSYYKKDYTFNYYMTKESLEIDLVITRPGKPLLFIEIKSKNNVQQQDIKELRLLKKDFPEAEYLCLSNDPYTKSIEDIKIYPWQIGLKYIFS